MGREEYAYLPTSDGEKISIKLFIPDGDGPFPVVLEALPYRKDDVTIGYESEYRRLRDEGGYVVCRADVRGTGSSSGIAEDEYTPREQQDWVELIDWLSKQSWSNGNVGMYGTSYSGFNSLQMAALAPPALKAIVSIFATDSRYTDDVHFGGGAQRGIDLVDYPNYMTALNAMPPSPKIFGEGWREEWMRRLDETPPWVVRWLEEQNETEYWLQGSIKTDYKALKAATLIVAGWADGYHNMAFRTLEEMEAPAYLLAGPWSHMSTENSIPGPHIDLVPEMIAWWDRWLKEDDASPAVAWPQVRAFMRRYTDPEPDLKISNGDWRSEPVWPIERSRQESYPLGIGSDEYAIRGDVGFYGSIWCAATMPWGTPMDQREDDALSLRYEWPVTEATGEIEMLGHPHLRVTVRSSVPVTYLSAKLCDVAPDGTSAMVSRGLLNLAHRDSHADPKPLIPGEAYDIDLELDATGWIFEPGHTMRLSVSTSDWPSSWAPPLPGTLTIERDGSELVLPVLHGPPIAPAPVFSPPSVASAVASATSTDSGGAAEGSTTEKTWAPPSHEGINPVHPVIWKTEHDVLARERRATVEYGYRESDPSDPLKISDASAGTIRVSTIDPGDSRVETTYELTIAWPEATVTTSCELKVVSDGATYEVHHTLEVRENDEVIKTKTWDRTMARDLQ